MDAEIRTARCVGLPILQRRQVEWPEPYREAAYASEWVGSSMYRAEQARSRCSTPSVARGAAPSSTDLQSIGAELGVTSRCDV